MSEPKTISAGMAPGLEREPDWQKSYANIALDKERLTVDLNHARRLANKRLLDTIDLKEAVRRMTCLLYAEAAQAWNTVDRDRIIDQTKIILADLGDAR